MEQVSGASSFYRCARSSHAAADSISAGVLILKNAVSAGSIPGNLYGREIAPISVQADMREFGALVSAISVENTIRANRGGDITLDAGDVVEILGRARLSGIHRVGFLRPLGARRPASSRAPKRVPGSKVRL